MQIDDKTFVWQDFPLSSGLGTVRLLTEGSVHSKVTFASGTGYLNHMIIHHLCHPAFCLSILLIHLFIRYLSAAGLRDLLKALDLGSQIDVGYCHIPIGFCGYVEVLNSVMGTRHYSSCHLNVFRPIEEHMNSCRTVSK